MLYPTTTVRLDAMPPMNALAPGSLLVINLTLAASQALLFTMVQLSPTQDFSLRGWISERPGGNFLPAHDTFWHFDRRNDRRIALYDMTAALPPGLGTIYPLPLVPGDYCMNILNLVNAENVFAFSVTGLPC